VPLDAGDFLSEDGIFGKLNAGGKPHLC
jgi:hypothetical protein